MIHSAPIGAAHFSFPGRRLGATGAQITAIIALLLYQPVIPGINTVWLGTAALWVAAILTLWSMLHYLRLAAPHMTPAAVTPAGRTVGRIEPHEPEKAE